MKRERTIRVENTIDRISHMKYHEEEPIMVILAGELSFIAQASHLSLWLTPQEALKLSQHLETAVQDYERISTTKNDFGNPGGPLD